VKAEQERQLAFRFETLIEQTKRLQSVSFRIMTANTGYCGTVTAPIFGLSVLSLDNLSESLRPLAAQRLGLDNRVDIVHVVKQSPARRAGLAPGDRILQVDGRKIPEGREGTRTLAQVFSRSKSSQSLRIIILRGARQLTFTMRPVAGCAIQAMLAGQNEEHAETNGRRIVIRRNLLRIATTDEELALIVGHELAHIMSGHEKSPREDKSAEVLGGFAVDARIRASEAEKTEKTRRFFNRSSHKGRDVFSQQQEAHADYLGMYFMARAGFGTQGVERFWRRMTEDGPRATPFAATHPVSAKRFALMTKTHDEISLKQRSQAPLEPNVKPGR